MLLAPLGDVINVGFPTQITLDLSLSVSHDGPGAKIREKNGPQPIYFEDNLEPLFQDQEPFPKFKKMQL